MKKYLYVLPTILTTMYLTFIGICWLNNFNVNTKLLIVISVLFLIPILLHIEQTIAAIFDSAKNNRIKWLPILLIFSIIAVPFYTNKYILNKIILKNLVITYIVSTIFLCALIGLYAVTIVGKNTEKIITTSDGKAEFHLDSNWKEIKQPGYSLYAENKKKKIAFGVETFDLKIFEGYTAEGLLEDRKNLLNNKFESVELYSDLKSLKEEEKTIKTTAYKVKPYDSDSYSIYILSVVIFDKDPDYILYVFEQVDESKYSKNQKELNNVLNEVKLK